MSPAVLRIGPYRLGFYALDRYEPPHVHVWRDRCEAKYWLSPLAYADSSGFSQPELRRIERIVREHAGLIQEHWDDFFGS